MEITNDKQNKKLNLKTWKNFLIYLRPYKLQFIKLGFIMVLLGIFDAIFPLLNKYAIDNFIIGNNITNIVYFAGIFFILVIFLAITVYGFISIAGKIETQMAYDLRKIGFEKLQNLPLSFYNKNAVGSLMSRLTSDILRLSEIISWGVVDILWGLSLMIVITIVMFRLNTKLAIITIGMLPILILISNYFQKTMLKSQRHIRKINSKITASFNEDIQGAKTTKTLNTEELNLKEFNEITESMRQSSVKFLITSSIYIPIVLIFGTTITSLVLGIGGNDVINGLISYGTLIVFISYASQFFEPINQIAIVFSELQTAQASAERFFELMDEELEIFDSEEVIENFKDISLPEMKGDIEFNDVTFYYTEDEIVLKNFNLDIKSGQTVALVGETGSGKSTIVNLISRFYEPKSGVIKVDGKDYKTLPQDFIHKNLGYVLQTPHLFNGTIKDNILYGNLDATDEDIVSACKLVDAHNFIMNLPDNYNYIVGEGGALLSTGQKQLISFARAIIKDPRLFILDEATSSIDTQTEQTIQKAINNILVGRTSFVIAHRLSTIKNADIIVVLQKGEIVEKGTHDQLLRNKGYYYELYTNQYSKNK